MTALNLDNGETFQTLFIYLFNKFFIDFLTNLKGKVLFRNNLGDKMLSFEREFVNMPRGKVFLT